MRAFDSQENSRTYGLQLVKVVTYCLVGEASAFTSGSFQRKTNRFPTLALFELLDFQVKLGPVRSSERQRRKPFNDALEIRMAVSERV